jgi:CelD/BcsL family acetyltransferase involved in cellulose biosynthesis
MLAAAQRELMPPPPASSEERPDANGLAVAARKKSGRKVKYDSKSDAKIAKKWTEAKSHGAYKPVFARENDMALKDLDRLLARERNRRILRRAK